jgi:hypothetical protein
MGYVLIVKRKGKKVGQKSLGNSTSKQSIARAKREWKEDHKYDPDGKKRVSYDVVWV